MPKTPPSTGTIVNNLGRVLQYLGDLEAVKEHCERALEIFRKFLGDNHPSTITVRDDLESLADVRGRTLRIDRLPVRPEHL
ncbi:MAG: tetratricopeptide repeat protein [Euryarchaeota archaeon]|nr:tetratricopeptide repeat protein [Euryarchaeota archaeon]